MKTLKITSIVTFLVVLIILSYYLFEPIFVYSSGWKVLPKNNTNEFAIINNDSLSNTLDTLLLNRFGSLNVPALSVSVGRGDSIFYSNSLGFADIEKQIKATPETLFRIGSTSKAVTSLGIGVLFQQKKLTLTSTVENFAAYTTSNFSKLTVGELASHTSGVRNYKTCFCFPIWENLNTKNYTSVEKSIAVFSNSDLLFEPGTAFSYSSYNYTLLSAVMEGASEKDFLDFMDYAVFKPLNLTNIKGEKVGDHLPAISKNYEVKESSFKEAYIVDNSNKWAGGGFIASSSDLARMGSALLNETLIDEETTKLLFTPVVLKNDKTNEQNYGLGWRIDTTKKVFKDGRLVKIIHHGGTAVGGTSVLILFPEHDIAISLLMNKSGSVSELFQLAYEIAKTIIEAKHT